MPLKLCTLYGTRPEIIRLSRVMALADEIFDHKTIHSGQNYDPTLSGIFFTQMGVRAPDYQLEMGTGSSLGQKLGILLSGVEEILEKEKPDALLILGDTNSALGVYMAKRHHIPIFHMEAGNRCFDTNVPEETNRKVVDHLSDYNLVYTEHARRHLISEGLKHDRIFVTGSPMFEVLDYYKEQIEHSDALNKLQLTEGQYILASFHREENVDIEKHSKGIISGLLALHQKTNYPVLVSTHPRTAEKIKQLGYSDQSGGIQFLPPFGFFDYCKLQKQAYCVVSDSGTISEESSILGFAAISPRYKIERPESLDTGNIIICPPEEKAILDSVETTVQLFKYRNLNNYPSDYKIENTSERVIALIQSMTNSHSQNSSLHKGENL